MFSNNKKSQLQTYLKAIIIGLVFLIVFLFFLNSFKNFTETRSTEDICKVSVETMSAQNIDLGPLNTIEQIEYLFGSKTKKASDIKCPTIYKTIDKKEDKEIMHELAENMRKCWNTFGEGRKKLFEFKKGDERYCIICHHLDFKKETTISGTEFLKYLKETKIPKIHTQGDDITYFKYLQRYRTNEDIFDENKIPQDYNIQTELPYSTVFVYTKRGNWGKIMGTAFGATIGLSASTGGVLFAQISTTAGIIGGLATGGAGGGLIKIAGSSIKDITGRVAPIVVLGIVILGTAAGGATGAATGADTTNNWDSAIVLIPYESINLKQLNCTYLPAIQTE